MTKSFDQWKYEKEEKGEEKKESSSFVVGAPKLISELNGDLAEPEWIWENYLARGHVTLLSALWKAGKSTLLRCMLAAIETGEEFCGQPVSPVKTLVLSEEPEGDWVSKREEFNLEESKNIYIWPRPIIVKPNLKQWVEFIEIVKQKALEIGAGFVVIDTLSTFWPIDNENDSAQVMKALVPLYVLTNENIGVLLVHHFRKGGGDQGQASRGSGALPGFVTNYIDFEFSSEGQYYDRTIKTKGRFENVIPKIIIRLSPDNKYKVLGEPWEVSKKARLEKVIEIFKQNQPLCSSDVLNFWMKIPGALNENISDRSIKRYLNELENKKILSVVETKLNGKKKTPYYVLTGTFPEQQTIDVSTTIGVVRCNDKTSDNPLDSLSDVNGEIVPPTIDKTAPIVVESFNKEWDDRI